MIMQITSLVNPRIKKIVQLRDRKYRDKSGLTIIEGAREIIRAFEAKTEFKEIYYCEEKVTEKELKIISRMKAKKVSVFSVTSKIFSKIVYGDRLEGILAIGVPKTLTLENVRVKKDSLFVIVEGVEKPGNLGAILRSCDGVGADGVLICDKKTDMFNPNVIRSSVGTVFSLNVMVCTNEEALNFLKLKKIKICAAMPYASTIYTKAEFSKGTAIVVGSEHKGLSSFWTKHADLHIRIPMRGRADSLNVSSSTAILLYEVLRQNEF